MWCVYMCLCVYVCWSLAYEYFHELQVYIYICWCMQDIEFTIEHGVLYILETSSAKRSAKAAVKVCVDMCLEGLITGMVHHCRMCRWFDLDYLWLSYLWPVQRCRAGGAAAAGAHEDLLLREDPHDRRPGRWVLGAGVLPVFDMCLYVCIYIYIWV